MLTFIVLIKSLTDYDNFRVATAQGNRKFRNPFSRQGKRREFAKIIKRYVFTQGICHSTQENVELMMSL